MTHSRKWIAYGFLAALLLASHSRAEENRVANGSFASDSNNDGEPDDWSTAGANGMQQTLVIDVGPTGGHAGKLSCTRFVSGSPTSHAMICQTGHVTVRKGRWYRLTWRAKARDMQLGAAQVALTNTRQWSNAGLNHPFPVGRDWRAYEHVFRASQDLLAADSRLQFWFGSTGAL